MSFSRYTPRSWVPISSLGVIGGDTSLALGAGTAEGTNWGPTLVEALSSYYANGNLGLLIDRAFTGYLPIYGSNVVVQGLPGCGIKRPQAWADAVVYGTNEVIGLSSGSPVTPSTGLTGAVSLGGQLQSNLTLRGFTIHASGTGSSSTTGTNGPVGCARLWGIEGLTIEEMNLFDSPGYTVHQGNNQQVVCRHNVINMPNVTTGDGDGRDGFHNDGPMDDCVYEYNTITTGDDAITLEANDGDTAGVPTPFPLPGPQTRIRILHNNFANSSSAIRGLSSDQLIDQVTISGNRGACYSASVVFDTDNTLAPDGPGNPRAGLGNLGAIAILDHDVQTLVDPLNIGSIWIQSSFDNLVVDGTFRPLAAAVNPYLWIYKNVPFNNLEFHIRMVDHDSANTARVICRDDGLGKTVQGRFAVSRPNLAPAALPVYRKTAGRTYFVGLHGYAESVNSLLEVTGGSVESVKLSGVHRNPGSGTGSLNVASGLTVANLDSYGLASTLRSAGSGTVTNSRPATADTYSLTTATDTPVAPPTSLTSIGLQAYYRFDATSGTTETDQVGGYNLTWSGTAITGATGLIAQNAGKAIQFDGTNYLSSSNAIFEASTSGPFTLFGWCKLGSASTLQVLCQKWAADGDPGQILSWDPGSHALIWQCGNLGNISVGLTNPTAWFFFVAMLDGEPRAFLSLNGSTPVGHQAQLSTTAVAQPFCIGSNYSGYQPSSGSLFDGWGRISRIITQAEINYLYNGGSGLDIA